jgi:hypothetical protein
MTHVDVLRSRATVLWRLAESFDIPLIRYDLRALATRCEELAEDLMREEAEQRESENALR